MESSLLAFFRYLLSMRNAGGLEHGESVMRLSLALGRRLSIPSGDLVFLEFGALVHDIGKLSINDGVLHKAGRLTRTEMVTMRQHSTEGARLLSCLGDLVSSDVVMMVQDHHEDYDGLGYPNQKKGKGIHWGGRIIRLADSFSAMTTVDRTWRPKKTPAQALEDLQENSFRYDPDFLPVFLEVVHDEF